jgi:hypothetical protein
MTVAQIPDSPDNQTDAVVAGSNHGASPPTVVDVDLTTDPGEEALGSELSAPRIAILASREKVRGYLAIGFVAVMVIIVATACAGFLISLFLGRNVADAREFGLAVIAFVSGSLTIGIMAFYFDRRH